MSQEKDITPLGIKILGWYGIIFGSLYLIVAIVNIILSIMDRTYKDIDKNFLIGLYGLPMLIFGLGFKSRQKWGWIGYAILLVVVVILSFFGPKDVYKMIAGILSLMVLAGILLPSVRHHFFKA
jgi:hypothetical protein